MTPSATTVRPPFSPSASVQSSREEKALSSALPRSADALFYGWLVARTLLWTLIAALTQHTPPLDTIEWLCWGREWRLGYHKHPPLAAWVGEIAFQLTPGSFFGVYLVGYLAIAVALWCVWRLAREFLPPRTALASVLCLDGLVFFQQAAAEFNNQVLLIAFWALSVLLFHRALTNDRPGDWIGVGLALGLALLCKYSAVFLIAPLLGLWLWRNELRRVSRPVVVALTAALVFLPHFVWLCRHDFPTLRYAMLRTQGQSGAFDHRLSAVTFLLSQGVRLLPVAVILLPLLTRRKPSLAFLLPSPRWGEGLGVRGKEERETVNKIEDRSTRDDRTFLAVAVLGPVVLHLAASLLLGLELRDIWGAPLWTFAGLLLLCFARTDDSDRAWRRMRATWGVVAGLSLLLALAGNLAGGLRGKPLRVHYPGRRLAREVTRRWQDRFGEPPPIVAGDWWLAGNVCCHARHRPTLYGSLEPAAFGLDLAKEKSDPRRFANPDPRTSPWTGDADLRRRGGVLVWDADCYGDSLPEWLRERFPGALEQTPLGLACAGFGPRVRVGWAMIGPAKNRR